MIEHELGDVERIAVAYSPRDIRDRFAAFLALDRRLGQIVAQTSEPMLGQMQLAWWRDMLRQKPAQRPNGDAVLDAIGMHWADHEEALIELVDGWEHMLTDTILTEKDARLCVAGRTAPLLSLLGQSQTIEMGRSVREAAWRWALGDMASKTVGGEEKALLLRLGLDKIDETARLPKQLRGLAVLQALGIRALKHGGQPLLEGRMAPLLAMRVAIVGQ